MRRFLFLILAWSLTALPWSASSSGLPSATWLPDADATSDATLSYLRAHRSVSTMLDCMETAEFQNTIHRLQGHLLTLPQEDAEKLEAFRTTLVQEGFEPLNIVSKERSARLKQTLKRSVCYVVGGKASRAPPESILATLTLTQQQSLGAAGVLAFAKLMEDFQLNPKRPIWVCAMPRPDTEQGGAALRELLEPQAKRGVNPKANPNANPRAFQSHIAIHGNEPAAFANHLGLRLNRFEFRERRFHWPKKDTNNALTLAKEVRQRLEDQSWPWQKKRKDTPAFLHISRIVCDKSLVSHARATCRFDVKVLSRSEKVLADCSKTHARLAQEATNEFNRALKEASGHPGIRLRRLPLSEVKPQPYQERSLKLAQALRSLAGNTPTVDSMLWSRFVQSEGVFSSAWGLPTVTLSAQPVNPFDETEHVKRLRRLGELLLMLSGLDADGQTIAPLALRP